MTHRYPYVFLIFETIFPWHLNLVESSFLSQWWANSGGAGGVGVGGIFFQPHNPLRITSVPLCKTSRDQGAKKPRRLLWNQTHAEKGKGVHGKAFVSGSSEPLFIQLGLCPMAGLDHFKRRRIGGHFLKGRLIGKFLHLTVFLKWWRKLWTFCGLSHADALSW